MEFMNQAMHDLEFGMDSDPPFDPGYLSASWDWKGISGIYVLNQPPAPQSLSPAASTESYSPSSSSSSSAAAEMPCPSREGYGYVDFQGSCPHVPGRRRERQKGTKMRMSAQRRRKASEREKLRMRHLAEALHSLQDYLPPDYAGQGGAPLTKAQTLKYSIQYIQELTEQLNSDQRA